MKKDTAIQARLFETMLASLSEHEQTGAMYLHSVLAQTSLPYRNPGERLRWQKDNGRVSLLLAAGPVKDPDTKDWIEVGLPFGPKARLILAHLSTEALVTGKQEVETEDTITRFISKVLEMDTKGRNVRTVRDQLTRLAACTIRLSLEEGRRMVHVSSQIVGGFDLWERDTRDAVLWPRTIKLSTEYFQSLQKHAVPLNESHLIALSHTSMGLDIYTWLAQRLHRIRAGEPSLIPWASLHVQFGEGYGEIRKFRQVFRVALEQVLVVYKSAHVDWTDRGLMLHNSATPVPPKVITGPWKNL